MKTKVYVLHLSGEIGKNDFYYIYDSKERLERAYNFGRDDGLLSQEAIVSFYTKEQLFSFLNKNNMTINEKIVEL